MGILSTTIKLISEGLLWFSTVCASDNQEKEMTEKDRPFLKGKFSLAQLLYSRKFIPQINDDNKKVCVASIIF